jgi:hypothetical protein
VTVIDRSATFDGLDYTHNGTPLSDYTEGLLFISTDGDSTAGWGPAVQPFFNPFHLPIDPATQAFFFADWGNTAWVTIRAADTRKVFGVEFLYGNGWTTGDIYGVPWGNSSAWVDWQTMAGSTVVSSGQIGAEQTLAVGTVIGFYDPAGFDQLMVRCKAANSSPPDFQELAIDDVHVQLSAGPYTPAEALRALEIAAGLESATPNDMLRLNVTGALAVEADDAIWILRKAMAL